VAVLSMSKQEFSRLEVLLRVQSGRLRVADACVLIGLQRRQVFRLLRGLKQDGATSLLSKRRGKPSNHQLPAEVRILALSIVRERYADFGPTLAAEKLAEHHGCSVSRETLRGWMIGDGLGRTVGIVCPRRISHAGGAIVWANWCRSTARSTPGLRTAVRPARCWLLWMMRRAG
jgi:Winged helix-turn helix